MFTSLTNLRIILITRPEITRESKLIPTLFKQVYANFAELVITDSNYSQNQPIQNIPFDSEINKIFSR